MSKPQEGTGPFEGMTWDGKQWVGDPSAAAMEARKAQPWVGAGSVPKVREDVVARRLAAVVYAVLAVGAVGIASSATQLFGSNLGGFIALGALSAAAILAIVALAKT